MTVEYWPVIWIALSWAVRLAMIPFVVLKKEHPATCLAWLMIVFFEPWFGLGLYLLIGDNRLVRKRLRRRETANATVEATSLYRDRSSRYATHHLVGEQETLAALGNHVGGLPVVGGNSMQFFADTISVIDGIVADIDAAQHHVHLLFYIYANDSLGRRVTDAIIRAKQRGVEVRVLLDDVGSWPVIRPMTAEMARHGIEFAASLPVSFARRGLARIDLRNHRKLVVVDGRTAWTGSQNVVEDTYGHRRAGRWRDIMARITGPAVAQFQSIFLEDWASDTEQVPDEPELFPPPVESGNVVMQVIPSGPDQDAESLQHLLVQAIHSAKRQIVLTTPYFVPDDAVVCALVLAATRGVEVQLIVPAHSDSRLVDLAGRFYLGYLLKYGVRVFRFMDGLLHAKTMTVDSAYGLFGSANYDVRSFELNFELNVSLNSEHAIRELQWIQQNYRAHSMEMTLADWQARPLRERLMVNIAKLFSPLL